MVDTGATHNFMTEKKAKDLCLSYVASNIILKTFNALPTTVHHFAPKVPIDLGGWMGCTNFTIAPMDIVKGFKRGEPTFLAALVGGVESSSEAVAFPPHIERFLCDNKDMMPQELPQRLPHRREIDSWAKATCHDALSYVAPGIGGNKEANQGAIDFGTYQAVQGDIWYACFIPKEGGDTALCIDYRDLNKGIVKNKYPIPLVVNLFDRLGQAKVFTKISLRKGYYQVQIVEDDEPKITCVTRYGSFEWLVMPFGLTNAPATFCTLMNKLFHLIWINIVVYNNSMEEHVFKVLRDNHLCVKLDKCSFAQPTVEFLGHTISHGEIRMDKDKVEAIRGWEAPTNVPELRSFLGLANYYRCFIFSYSAIATPLTDLLKKNHEWKWTDSCKTAFEKLKAAITNESVMALPDFTKAFQ
uniref:Reverse transcriptase domain-containing protein n=1 Tax=Solanum lycopersicum TaxID=4081 RepID=A0A3Q7EVL0_SOLLC